MEYGSEYDSLANRDYLGGNGWDAEGAEYYRSGRDAIKALTVTDSGQSRVVLLPAMCCESMILPFALNGYQRRFYRLKEDLSGDEGDVLDKLEDGAVLLFMRYFGVRPFEDRFLRKLKNSFNKLVLVEDRTHDMFVPRGTEGFSPDAMLSSLRKWAALPDGGVLVTKLPHSKGEDDQRFCSTRRIAMEKKSRYLQSFEPELKEQFLRELNAASDMLDESGIPVGMAPEYRQLIRELDFEKILRDRRRNIACLRERLRPELERRELRLLTDKPEDSCIYFPILVERQKAVQLYMAQRDIYCPVIWPVPEEAKGVCPVCENIGGHMLALPCDQRYGEDDMAFIADTLAAALKAR